MLKGSFQVFFSYILIDESVLPSPGVTSITRIARTAIALPTRLLVGQITRTGYRHKPVLNGLGICCPRPATATMGNELDLRMGASFRWTGSKQTIYGFKSNNFHRQHTGDNRNRFIAADDRAVPCE